MHKQYSYLVAIVLTCLIVATISLDPRYDQEMRFKDGPMLRTHHNHSNPSNAQITVHLIPHSHDDVGWLKTVDDYFYGGDQATQWAGVQYTIDTVVTQLDLNPNYKFSFVQVAFLYRWWNGANTTQRDAMKRIIKNDQVEFINAGWCMNDEANAYYEDIIDQMGIGFRWIKDTFGVVPTIGWHIDPFGHQSSQAALFSQMGFNAWFFARIDYQDKSVRLTKQAMEMIWHPPQSSGQDNPIFTHVNFYHYSPPPGFCFDNNCRDQPIKDDITLDGYNLVEKSTAFANYFKSMATHYRTNNLLHTLGQDFHYANAHMWYKNVDKLLKYVNQHPELGVTILYSTPAAYLKAANTESATYPTKYDDFFPYADVQHGFWTGYFVSRTSFKSFIREAGRYTTSVRTHLAQLLLSGSSTVLKNSVNETEQAIWGMEMANGILQHHDAVAGTAKQKVTNNYIITTSKAQAVLNNLYNKVRAQQIYNQIGENVTEIFSTTWNTTAEQWGISKALAAKKTVLLSIYNPGPKGSYQIRIKVEESSINIIGSGYINGDLICSNVRDSKDCELLFTIPIEQASYYHVKLSPLSSGGTAKVAKLHEILVAQSTKTLNVSATASLKFTRANQKLDLLIGSNDYAFTVNYNYYESYQGSGQKSGAYIFRPSVDTIQNNKKYTSYKSYHYAEGQQFIVFVLEGDKSSTKLYFSKTAKYVEDYGFEVETHLDSIDISDRIGKEVVLDLGTNLSNNKTFYTDSNGLQQLKRVVDFRPTWTFNNDEPVSGNYYPVSSHISITDGTNKVTVLVDRPQGATSVKDGVIEVMLNRRTTMDDGRGVGQPLDEVQQDGKGLAQKYRHYVLFNSNNHRQVQKRNDQKPIIVWSTSSSTSFGRRTTVQPAFKVPDSVRLYLRPYPDGTYHLRLHNFDQGNSATVSIPAGWSITEYALGFNQLLEEAKQKKYSWKEEPYTDDKSTVPKYNHSFRLEQEGEVQLRPFEIRTFKLVKS